MALTLDGGAQEIIMGGETSDFPRRSITAESGTLHAEMACFSFFKYYFYNYSYAISNGDESKFLW
jgi:hypothetical protein